MKRFAIFAVTGALAIPALALADDSYKLPPSNAASAACKAERAQMGAAAFKQAYGTNKTRSNAFGKCVSKHTKSESTNQSNAAKACKAELGGNKKDKNAYGKCVS